MTKIRVLLVDDHAILRDGLQVLLALCDDLEVVAEAGDGEQAIACVRQHAPDVVVMDLSMPRMDGFEATRVLTKQYPDVRILVLSQYDNERYILPVLRAGAIGYVDKRAVGEELVSAIRHVARGEPFLPPSVARIVLQDYQHVEEQAAEQEYHLTQREKEILKLVAEGHTTQEIANRLFLSKKTVMCHRGNIYHKLGTHERTELNRYATSLGLVQEKH